MSADANAVQGAVVSQERADAVRDLESEFGELIARFRQVMTANAERLSPGMLPGAYRVFTTIARCKNVTPSVLADKLFIDKAQISRTVRELQDLGLVRRDPDPSDGRSSLLSATTAGLARLEAAREPQEGILMRVLDEWPVHDIQNLSRLLHALTSGETP